MRFLNTIALLILAFLMPSFAFAQTSTTSATVQQQIDKIVQDRLNSAPSAADIRTGAIGDYLDVKTSPQNPGPNETIRITVESYLSDLNKATISWWVDGKLVERGLGKTTFSFRNGASGSTTRLTISITTNAGERVTKELSWSPVGITMLWEANTYTPPFYRGKALMTPQASVRAIAIPDNTGTRNALDAGNLVYTWKKDGTAVPTASGYGKNSFSFPGPKPYGESKVSVQVSSVNDTIKTDMNVVLPLSNPFILFYENHPLLGTWYNRALGDNLTLAQKEFSLSAEPYFFSNETGEAPTLAYNWTLNGKDIVNPGRAITLRNETGGKGDSLLTLTMRGLKQTFQTANQDLGIHFTTKESSQPTF